MLETHLPTDLYVVSVRWVDQIVCVVEMCNVPPALAPECRYVPAAPDIDAERLRLAAENERLTKERDEAQAACDAWQEVYEGLEAHIRDRMAMGDPASPETYLSILLGDVAEIKHASRQIVNARWADNRRHAAENERLREALRPFVYIARCHCADAPEWRDSDTVSHPVWIGDLRRARAALERQP